MRTAVTKAQLPLLDIKPTVAYKFSDWLSFGFGVDIFTFANFLAEGQSEKQLIGIGQFPGTAAGDRLELNGTGTTAGINVSVMVTPLRNAQGQPVVNLGFIWRSQAVLPLKGELLANGAKIADASTNLRFPESYEWGLAVWRATLIRQSTVATTCLPREWDSISHPIFTEEHQGKFFERFYAGQPLGHDFRVH